MRISVLDLQYVPAQVNLRDSGLVVNLSSDVVQMAFPVAEVAPVGGDWKTAVVRTSLCSFRATIVGIEYRREEIVAGTRGDSQKPRKPSVSY